MEGKPKVKSLSSILFVATVSMLGPASMAQSTPAYTIIQVVTPPAIVAGASGLNNNGDVVGNTLSGHAGVGYLNSGGNIIAVGSFAGNAYAAVNDHRQIVGVFENFAPEYSYAFLQTDGAVTNIGPQVEGAFTSANALNNSGQVVGDSAFIVGGPIDGFLYSGGALINLTPGGGSAKSINSSGQITGYADVGTNATHAFLYSNGVTQDLAAFGDSSIGYAINDSGQIAIVAQSGSSPALTYELFLYNAGVGKDLGPIGPGSVAMNSSGQIVGTNAGGNAFLYSSGVFTDLNTQIPAGSGWLLQNATGINDSGQITGNGLLNGSAVPFLLTPVPKPSCQISSIVNGPPKQLIVAMQDTSSGLESINLEDSVNASVSIPAFSPGTTSQVLVKATKIDQTQSSDVAFQVTNMAGVTTSCDPVDFTVSLDGATERHVFRSVDPAEHYIRITNGTPGVRQMTFFVNAHSFPVPALKDGETYSLDIGSAVATTPESTEAPRIGPRPVPRRGQSQAANSVVMYASGQRGSSAYILIGDASVLSGSTAQTHH